MLRDAHPIRASSNGLGPLLPVVPRHLLSDNVYVASSAHNQRCTAEVEHWCHVSLLLYSRPQLHNWDRCDYMG